MASRPRYRRNPAVAETAIGDELFLVEPDSQEVFYLDPVTSALWRLLTEPRSADDIAALFGEAFPEIDPARIAADVAQALADMTSRCLVVTGRAGGRAMD